VAVRGGLRGVIKVSGGGGLMVDALESFLHFIGFSGGQNEWHPRPRLVQPVVKLRQTGKGLTKDRSWKLEAVKAVWIISGNVG